MKIEMGESLFYSWLRHVKECQIVQTNWKVSPQWTLQHEEELQELMAVTDTYFEKEYGYKIYKKNASLSQVIQQGECDALGVSFQDGNVKTYAVDVAFHENGLNYGSRETTVMKVINKCIRTSMCIYGYMDIREAEIIFASPKIYNAVLIDAEKGVADAERILREQGYQFTLRIIANEDFNNLVLSPILLASNGIADTSELFLRSYQMIQMFDSGDREQKKNPEDKVQNVDASAYRELKVGKLAQIPLREILESGKVSSDEITHMQTLEYSREHFGIGFPLLAKAGTDFDASRYYQKPLEIFGETYYMTSQWYEGSREYIMRWIRKYK